jgi:glutathione-regulated potassium-efflux system ancillary protein KefG
MSHSVSNGRRPAFPPPTRPASDARVLVLFVHPAHQNSRVNRPLMEAARAVPGVTVHDLYERYPDHHVDVATEQSLLAAHETIVFQHPFYWYSSPSLLKAWQDLVLELGWAYGPGGTALAGKRLLSAITTGGRDTAYTATGSNRFTVRQFLAPFEQTAHLCRMTYLPPLVFHGTFAAKPSEVADHAVLYARVLAALVSGRSPPQESLANERLDHDLGWLEVTP